MLNIYHILAGDGFTEMETLYITGAGVSDASGIPTFRGQDGSWTIGSRHYTPQEMARVTRDGVSEQSVIGHRLRLSISQEATP